MFKLKRAFFQWFLAVCALAAGGYYAYLTKFTQLILVDKSNICFVILSIIVFTILHLGIISWRLDTANHRDTHRSLMWPGVAISILPLLGMVGTIVGFIMQADALTSGSAGLGPLGTSLFASLFGVGGAFIIHLLRFNVRYCLSVLIDNKDKETSIV